jgi:hypothetical protein
MLETLRGAIAYMREKQILHKLGVAISIAIIATACYILYHMLQGLDVDDLYSALRDTEIKTVVLAGLCVAAGYFTLTFYDLFALRAIGRDKVPYRVAAFAGFTSYSIGHNVGASVFTGGVVRYRIYSAWDLSAVDVAKVCFLAGLRRLSSGSGGLHRQAADLAQSRRGDRHPDRPVRLCDVGLDKAPRSRARKLVRRSSWWSADAAADRDRHCRSRILRAGDVHPRAG